MLAGDKMKVNIGVSNRHVHLTEEDFKVLFGENAKLECKNALTQPGEFASTSLVTLRTEKNEIPKVRVLGPLRSYTQIEISKTDSYKLGLNPPIRESGNIINSEIVTIIGPNGKLENKEGCIIATRHIHATEEDCLKYGLDPNKKYIVKIGGIKGGTMNNVSIKVNPNYLFEMHVDQDDANAHFINKENNVAEIIGEDNESI